MDSLTFSHKTASYKYLHKYDFVDYQHIKERDHMSIIPCKKILTTYMF